MKRSRNLSSYFTAICFAIIFIALGFWQLDRAAQVRELQRPYQELPEVSLSEVAQPSENLGGESINRIVTFSGRYVIQLDAPQQRDSAGAVATWSVGVFEVDGGGDILVVRSDKRVELPKGTIQVTGRLFPRQFDDQIDNSAQDLSSSLRRIDPALVVAQYGGEFYDGYVVAESELVDGKAVIESRVKLEPARPTTPGYYWQHIAYVVIWWLMALVVLFLPIYSKRREEGR